MSDTPETDDELNYNAFGFYTMGGLPTDAVCVDFARKLERERDKWEETGRLYCQNSDFHREMCEKAERERDEWKAEAEQWRGIVNDYRDDLSTWKKPDNGKES